MAAGLGLVLVDYRSMEHELAIRVDAGQEGLVDVVRRRSWRAHMAPVRRETLADCIREVVVETAECSDALIVGSSAPVVLAGSSNVLAVRISAPKSMRAAALRRRLLLPHPATAEMELDSADGLMDRAMRALFGDAWRAADLFDLMIDASRVSAGEAAHRIRLALAAREASRAEAGKHPV